MFATAKRAREDDDDEEEQRSPSDKVGSLWLGSPLGSSLTWIETSHTAIQILSHNQAYFVILKKARTAAASAHSGRLIRR
jgi:hypothetical protein